MAREDLERREPSAVDLEVAARELADRESIPFEVALEDVRLSMAKRQDAVRRIRVIREEGEARIAAMRAEAASGEDTGRRPAAGTA